MTTKHKEHAANFSSDKVVGLAIPPYSLQHPSQDPLEAAQRLVLQGTKVCSSSVRGVWRRHNLLTKQERLLPLEKSMREQSLELSDEQIKRLERLSPELLERHIETKHTGDLVAVDTFLVCTLKGVGRIYLLSG
ncbi:hypothetical protein DESUT3_28700 [Desulfuromonas versatilis]|uniref:Transposase n=1 Tax=Desulfuromonas versatilis TaxID=2802975 RepID=A0ABN6E3P6_9BACT|nr:hypothetical protein DESUT3_28700 [Desulfuromonas versatilis]